MTPITKHELYVVEHSEINAQARQARHEAKKQKRGKLHEANRAKAKARRKALQVIFAAAINAKEY